MAHERMTLAEIAQYLDAELQGDPACVISSIATLQQAAPGQVSFLANPVYARYLATTQATAVILAPQYADQCPVSKLILKNPYLGYARLSHRFDGRPRALPGIHPTAVIAADAQIDPSASIGAQVFVGAACVIGEAAEIGAACTIGDGCQIGARTRLAARVTLYHGVQVGEDCILHSGAVLGADGFGFAPAAKGWQKIAQVGGVVIGNQVEIGANTTIDRGALEDTRIGDGAKLDNQIQIAHNVQIGEHTVIAACVGISGSSRIGAHCVIGGGCGISGHVEIADHVHLTGMTMVTHNLKQAGVYSSGTGIEENHSWRKNAVRFRQLDDLARRLKHIEQLVRSDEASK